jgi:hypothetical protein
MKGPFASGEALNDHLGVFADEYAHIPVLN